MRRIGTITTSAALVWALSLSGLPARQAATTKGGAIEGVVTDELTGEPIPEVQIRLTGGAVDPAAYDRLKTTLAARKITIPPADNLSPEEFAEAVRDLAAASGMALNNPQLLSAVNSFLSTHSGRFRTQSGHDGRFLIGNLPPGRYQALIQSGGYFPTPEATAATVTVSPDRTASLPLTMIPGGTIAGRVTRNGKPQPGLSVQAYSIRYLNGYQVLQQVVSRSTDDRGQYRLFYLPPGEYAVAVTPESQVAPSLTSLATDATPARSPATPVEQPLRTFYPGTVDRTAASLVSLNNGHEKAVAGATVALVPALPYRQNRARFQTATADSNGKFNIGSVAPGEYKLFAWTTIPEGAYFNAAFLSRYEEMGAPVTVSGQAASVAADLNVLAPTR